MKIAIVNRFFKADKDKYIKYPPPKSYIRIIAFEFNANIAETPITPNVPYVIAAKTTPTIIYSPALRPNDIELLIIVKLEGPGLIMIKKLVL